MLRYEFEIRTLTIEPYFPSIHLGPCQTSGLAAAVAKRPGCCETAFERGYIDSYVKRKAHVTRAVWPPGRQRLKSARLTGPLE